MWQRIYRAVLVLCAVGVALNLPTVSYSLRSDFLRGNALPFTDFAAFFGFALLPVAAVGLWNMRLWGMVTLVTGMLIFAGAAIFHVGVTHGIAWMSFHFVCACATALLYVRTQPRHRHDSFEWERCCIHCDGLGKCKTCGGTGELEPIVPPTDPRMSFLVPCGNCSGTGNCLACQADWREMTTAQATNWSAARSFAIQPVRFPVKSRFASLFGLNSTGSFFSLQRMFLSLTLVGIAGSSSWYLTRPELLDSPMYWILLGWRSFLGFGVGILWRKPLLGAFIGLALTWMALKTRG